VLPYIDIPPINLGVTEIHPFGILLAAGVLFGSYMCRRFLDRYGMDDDTCRYLVFRTLVGGFVLCHVINAVFYEPDRLFQWRFDLPWDDKPGGPLLLFYVWDGISSYGGIVGALVVFLIVVHRAPGELNRRRWLDMLVYGLVPGFWFGRMGCAVAHDHIGINSDFPLAVAFPSHRFPHHSAHDLGLYEALFLMPVIFVVVFLIERVRSRRDGMLSAVAGVMYSAPRFFLDFLRREDSDPRYFGLTPAQYFSIFLFAASLWLLVQLTVRKRYTIASEGDAGSLPAARVAEPPG